MEKIVTSMMLILTLCTGMDDVTLQHMCLECHQAQKIPSELIYRRYLMRYSTSARIESAMISYLKMPQKEHSIMPPQFFLKFPMKEAFDKNETALESGVRKYIEKYDIRKRLILKTE